MRTPKLRRHKSKDLAFVECRALFKPPKKYLGKWGSEEAKVAYAHILARLADLEANGVPRAPVKHPSQLTVNDLSVLFLRHHKALAIRKSAENGKNPKRSEFANLKAAARPLWKTHGKMKVADFGPKAMRDVQAAMVAKGWCRRQVNAQLGRVRRIFKWGVSHEMVAPEILTAICTVPALREGESAAPEKAEIGPVAWRDVSRVLPFMSPHVADMVRVGWLTGARPDELTSLKAEEIDRSDSIWVFRPQKHKTTWRGKQRFVCFGWKSQRIMLRYWTTGYLFSPAKAMAAINRRRKGMLTRYTAGSFQHAVNHAFAKLVKLKGGLARKKGQPMKDWLAQYGIVYWHPNQLRHSRATAVRATWGVEAAGAAIGDSFDAALIYAEQSLDLAKRIASEGG